MAKDAPELKRSRSTTRRAAIIVSVLIATLLVVLAAGVWRVPQRLYRAADCWSTGYFDNPDGGSAWSPDGATIAFTRRTGIWGIHPDGSGLRRLSHASTCWGDVSASWSPDGKRLAVADDNGISLIDVGGNRRRKLVKGGSEPAWSRDGRWIAFTKGGLYKTKLYVIRADGTHLRKIDTDGTQVFAPSWSPDGSRIVFSGNKSGLYVARVGGDGRVRISDEALADSPAWSPDGKWIAFSDNNGILVNGVGVMSASGGPPTTVVDGGQDSQLSTPTWSPDSRRIAFYDPDSREILVVNADGSGLHKITDV